MMHSSRCSCGQPSYYQQFSYVRNDPVNLVDPDGRQAAFKRSPDGSGGEDVFAPFNLPFVSVILKYTSEGIISAPLIGVHNPIPAVPTLDGKISGGGRVYHGWNQKSVESKVVKLLNKGTCASFIKDLFNRMYRAANPGASDSVIDGKSTSLFSGISRDLGIGAYSKLQPTIDYSSRKGQTKPNSPTAIASADWNSNPRRIELWDPFFYNTNDISQAQTVIGEAIHIETRHYDSYLADLLGWKAPADIKPEDIENQASQFFHGQLENACKP
jgi:hypothetical protein